MFRFGEHSAELRSVVVWARAVVVRRTRVAGKPSPLRTSRTTAVYKRNRLPMRRPRTERTNRNENSRKNMAHMPRAAAT